MDPSLYLDRDTFVHRLDPRTKMFLLLGTFVLAFVFMNPLYLLAVLAMVLFFGYLSQSLANLRRIWFILVTIALVSIILWSIFGSGERRRSSSSSSGRPSSTGWGIALRLDATIVAGMIFLSTTRNEEMAIGLVRLGIPYRFAFAVSTALRLVPTIVATGLTISQAQSSRGLDLDSGNIFSRSAKHCRSWFPSSSPRSARRTCSAWRWSPRVSARAPGARSISLIAMGRRGTPSCSVVLRAAPGRVHRAAGDGVRGPGRVQPGNDVRGGGDHERDLHDVAAHPDGGARGPERRDLRGRPYSVQGVHHSAGVDEVRPANVFPFVFGLLFGPAGAWGAAIGNLIGDFFGHP